VVSLAIFRELFRLPRAVVYNSIEERAMIWSASGNRGVPGDVVGVGSELPATADGDVFRRKFEVSRPYMLFVGRVDPNKGCRTLFHYFRRYREETASSLDLLLVGGKQMEVPAEPGVRYLGFLSEQDKWGALAGAELLVMPSELESLSMVTLEAWGMGNRCSRTEVRVLRGQCRRSNAGLYFDDYYEFRRPSLLEQSPSYRAGTGATAFYHQNYRWEWWREIQPPPRDPLAGTAPSPAPNQGFFAESFPEGPERHASPPDARRLLLRRRHRERGAPHPGDPAGRGFDSDIFAESVHPEMAGRRESSWDTARSRRKTDSSSPFLDRAGVSTYAYHLPDRFCSSTTTSPRPVVPGFHRHLAGLCYHGRRELQAFVRRPPRARRF
jgi:hypothetical protein